MLISRKASRYITDSSGGIPLLYFLIRMSVQAKLTVVGGKASKRTVSLRLPTSIGRGRDAGLRVAHPQISRKHCELIESDGLVVIRDVGSLNGTYVDSKRIKEAPLPPDATFSIGPLTFRIRYQLDADTSRLPPTIPADDPEAAAPAGEISETMPVKDKPAEVQLDDDDPALDDFLKGIT